MPKSECCCFIQSINHSINQQSKQKFKWTFHARGSHSMCVLVFVKRLFSFSMNGTDWLAGWLTDWQNLTILMTDKNYLIALRLHPFIMSGPRGVQEILTANTKRKKFFIGRLKKVKNRPDVIKGCSLRALKSTRGMNCQIANVYHEWESIEQCY